MNCHYTDYKGTKVFIPGCWSSAIHGPDACTCEKTPVAKSLKERVDLLEKIVANLSAEVKRQGVEIKLHNDVSKIREAGHL